MRNQTFQPASQRPSLLTLEILFRILITGSLLISLAGCGIGGLGNATLNFGCCTYSPELSLSVSSTLVAPGAPVTIAITPLFFSNACSATFYDQATALGTATVYTSSAELTTTFTAGTHNLSASCAGLTSNSIAVTVAPQTIAPIAPGGAADIYAIPNYTNTLGTYATGSQGDLTPSSTLTFPSGFTSSAVATDATGQIYVGGATSGAPEVLVFAAGAHGSATPRRSILGSASAGTITSLCVDANGLLYVATVFQNTTWQVSVYAANASGTAAPLRQISGTLTIYNAESGPITVATDAAANLYVAGLGSTIASSQIAVYPPAATTPSRVITASGSGLFAGLAVDAAGDIYAGLGSNLNDSIDSIVEFGPTASGTATPIRTLSGAATQIAAFETVSLAVDTAGNLYFAEDDSATFNILVFGPTAQGNDAPSAYITSGLFTSFVQLAVH